MRPPLCAKGRGSARSLWRTASSTTHTPPMPGDWTVCGGCISGSTAAPKGRSETGVWWRRHGRVRSGRPVISIRRSLAAWNWRDPLSAASLAPFLGRRGHSSPLPAFAASAKELVAAIRLKPRHAHAARHLERLQKPPRAWIDAPQIAFVPFPGGVPELAVYPGDPGNEAVRLDGTKDCPGLGIDLVDFSGADTPHP